MKRLKTIHRELKAKLESIPARNMTKPYLPLPDEHWCFYGVLCGDIYGHDSSYFDIYFHHHRVSGKKYISLAHTCRQPEKIINMIHEIEPEVDVEYYINGQKVFAERCPKCGDLTQPATEDEISELDHWKGACMNCNNHLKV